METRRVRLLFMALADRDVVFWSNSTHLAHADAVNGPDAEESAGLTPGPGRSRLTELLQKKFDIRSVALTGLFILAIFYTMYFVRAVLLPLVLALLLSYLLRPMVRALARFRIPPALSSALLLIGLIGAIGYGVFFLSAPAAGWLEKAPYSLHRLQAKLYPLKRPMAQMQQATGEIEKITSPDADAPAKTAVEVKTHPIASLLFVRTPEVI